MLDVNPMKADKTEPTKLETVIIVIAFIIVAVGFAYAILTPRSVFSANGQPSSAESAQSSTLAPVESALNLH